MKTLKLSMVSLPRNQNVIWQYGFEIVTCGQGSALQSIACCRHFSWFEFLANCHDSTSAVFPLRFRLVCSKRRESKKYKNYPIIIQFPHYGRHMFPIEAVARIPRRGGVKPDRSVHVWPRPSSASNELCRLSGLAFGTVLQHAWNHEKYLLNAAATAELSSVVSVGLIWYRKKYLIFRLANMWHRPHSKPNSARRDAIQDASSSSGSCGVDFHRHASFEHWCRMMLLVSATLFFRFW